MRKINLFILLVITSLLVGCAEQATTTNTKISLGASTGSAQFDGGLYLFAKNADSGDEIIKLIPPSDELVLELPTNSRWKFSAIGWNGPQNFEGDVYCAKTATALTLPDGDFDVPLIASRAGCLNSSQPLASDNNFPKLSVANCYGIKGYLEKGLNIPTNASCGGETLIQGAKSYLRVTLNQINSQGIKSPGLKSECIPVTTQQTDTNINVPDGVGFNRLEYDLTLHDVSDCSDAPTIYSFKEGLHDKDLAFDKKGVVLKPADRTMLLVNEESCVGAQLTNSPFAAGSTASGAYLICTPTQWANIAIGETGACTSETAGLELMGCEADAAYVVGQDIDFGGSNTPISNTFTGSLKGGTHILSNFDKPLFDSIQTSSSDVRISDLNISGVTITETGLTNTSIGILARKLLPGGSKRIEIDNIQILNSSITDNSGSNIGSIGGLIGAVDFQVAASGEDVFIRWVHSNTDITSNSSSGQYIGGLIGEFLGSGTVNLAFEANYVGMIKQANDEYDYSDFSEAISITSTSTSHVIGGLVGAIKDAELRTGNSVLSEISSSSTSGVGGLVGEVYSIGSHNKIANSFARMNFTPTGNITGGVGGVLGKAIMASNNTPIHIEGSHGEVLIGTDAVPVSSFTIDSLGGIVGMFSGNGSSPDLKITDSRSVMKTFVSGAQHGGIIGKYNYTGSTLTSVIERSISLGTIGDESSGSLSTSSNNIERGGLVGNAQYIDSKMNLVDINIEGYSYIGGAYGISGFSKASEFDLTASLAAYNGGVGGVGGQFNAGATTPVVKDIKLNSLIITLGQDVADCTAAIANCGQLYGSTDLGGLHSTNIVSHNSSILDSNSDDLNGSDHLCGANEASCDVGTEVTDIQFTELTDCSGVITPFSMDDIDDDGTPTCELAFMQALSKFAPISGGGYRMGSVLDPYQISDPADWNEIGDDAFLTSKSFEIINDIDFAFGTFTPVGTNGAFNQDNSFSGTIFGSGILRNISLTTAGTSGGLINTAYDGQVGLRQMPLKVDTLNLDCGSSSYCGLLGEAKNVRVFAHVANGTYTSSSTPTSIGGLIGRVEGENEISNSGFEGSIDNTGGSNAGGLVGELGGGMDGSVRIDESFAKLKSLIGPVGAGGLIAIANATGGANSSIMQSYVRFDVDNQHGGDDIQGSSYAGGLCGTIGTNMSIDKSYVDIISAQVPGTFRTIATGTGLISNTSNGIVAPGAGWVNDGTWSHTYQASDYEDLKSTITDFDDDDWLTDSNGRLVLSWEIEGFED